MVKNSAEIAEYAAGYKDLEIKDIEKYSESAAKGIELFAVPENIGDARAVNALNERIPEIYSGALDELAQALANVFGEEAETVVFCRDNKEREFIRSETAQLADERTFKEIMRELGSAAELCRANGTLPYYLTMICGYGFACAQKQPLLKEIKNGIDAKGLKYAAEKVSEIYNKPDLIQLINEQYQNARRDILETKELIALKKRAYNLGFFNEEAYRGCGQCALLTMFELTGDTDELLFQMATGLSGGMAICNDGACGGYSGGILFLGRYSGRRLKEMKENGDKETQYKNYYMCQDLHDKFTEAFGSVVCKDIHCKIFGGRWFCLRDKEVRDEFEEAGAHKDKCTAVIANACMWIAEILVKYGYLNI